MDIPIGDIACGYLFAVKWVFVYNKASCGERNV